MSVCSLSAWLDTTKLFSCRFKHDGSPVSLEVSSSSLSCMSASCVQCLGLSLLGGSVNIVWILEIYMECTKMHLWLAAPWYQLSLRLPQFYQSVCLLCSWREQEVYQWVGNGSSKQLHYFSKLHWLRGAKHASGSAMSSQEAVTKITLKKFISFSTQSRSRPCTCRCTAVIIVVFTCYVLC